MAGTSRGLRLLSPENVSNNAPVWMTASEAEKLTSLEVRTLDADVGLTIALWLADLLHEAGVRRLSVEDDGILGPPIRRAALQRPRFDVTRDAGGVVRVRCSSSVIFFQRRLDLEAARKLLVVAGLAQDAASITQDQVVRVQADVVAAASDALGVERRRGSKVLLRVDDFPSAVAKSDDLLRFHEAAMEEGVQYLLAVTPFLDDGSGQRRLSTAERRILDRVTGDGVELALHGFTHRSRYSNFGSEILHVPGPTLERALAEADQYLAGFGFSTSAFVAPYNTYDPFTVSILAKRFAVLCGGPESVHSFGYRAGPSSFMGSTYVPSYRGAYELTDRGLPHLERLLATSGGGTLPITMHWANHVDSEFRTFRAIARRIKGSVIRWSAVAHAMKRLNAGLA